MKKVTEKKSFGILLVICVVALVALFTIIVFGSFKLFPESTDQEVKTYIDPKTKAEIYYDPETYTEEDVKNEIKKYEDEFKNAPPGYYDEM